MIALFPCRSPSSSVTFTPTPQPARVRPVRLVRSVVPRLLDQACSRGVVGGRPTSTPASAREDVPQVIHNTSLH